MSSEGKLKWDLSKLGRAGPGCLEVPQHKHKFIQDKKNNKSERWLGEDCIGQILSIQDHCRPAIQLVIKDVTYTCILDTQASGSFVSNRIINSLPKPKESRNHIVNGAVEGISYKVVGQTILRGKCASMDIEIDVLVIDKLMPDVILGHDFLEKYHVIIDYTANEIFMGVDHRKRVAWYNGNLSMNRDKEEGTEIEGKLNIGPLNNQQVCQLKNLLNQYPEVITEKIGYTNTVKHKIVCKDYEPIKQKSYPMNADKRNFVIKKIQEMEEQGLIEPSQSGWASPIVLPKKKNGDYRLCVDYRKLNNKTVNDAYPMPDLKAMLKRVNGATIFTTMDLNSGYWQVEVEETSRPLTAFTTPRGLYHFRVMPFGLKNAPATFTHLMEEVLSGYTGEFCQVYLDDILIYSKDFNAHLVHLAKVLERLKIHGLTCQLKKCNFASSRVEYLGHVLTPEGLERQPEKNKAIAEMERPRTKRQVRQFLGTCGWYSSFVPQFEIRAAPLTDLLHEKKPFKWTGKEEKAFQDLKRTICDAPRLAHPDPSRMLCLQTDASDLGLGAVLFQENKQGGRDIIEYASRKIQPAEKNYCTAEKEALAVVWAVGKFRGHLEGRQFKLYTDNSALRWLNSVSGTKSKLMRWALLLAEFDFEVIHVSGTSNQAADSLSRNPSDESRQAETLPEREVPTPPKTTEQPPVLMALDNGFGKELIKKWQEEDEVCKKMIDWIRSRSDDRLGVPRSFKTCYKNLRLQDGILVYVSKFANQSPVTVLPKAYVDSVLQKYHDNTEAVHPGREETYHSIRQRFFWVAMKKDIAAYVRSCSICARTKATNQKPNTTSRGRQPHQPWEVLAIDIMGPYPRTSRGKTNILVVTDLFTRWVEAFAIPEATSSRILHLLRTEVFSRYGYPRCLLSDNGSQFTSRLWKQTLYQWNIEHWTTPIYHPQANPTERRNQELKRMLRVLLVDKPHKKWDEHLPQSLLALRQRTNRVTGYSPAELFLGRPIRRIGDWSLPATTNNNQQTVEQWYSAQQQQGRQMQTKAAERTLRQAEAINVKEEKELQPGQLVMRRNHVLSNKAKGFHAGLAPKWLGPYTVARKLGEGIYELKTNPPVKVHAAELKPLEQPLRTVNLSGTGSDASDSPETEEEQGHGYNLRPRK